MFVAKSHSCCIEIVRRVLRHYHEVELVGLRGGDDVVEVARAVTAEKGMHMHDSFVLNHAGIGRSHNPLRIDLLNRRMKAAQLIATVGEGNL